MGKQARAAKQPSIKLPVLRAKGEKSGLGFVEPKQDQQLEHKDLNSPLQKTNNWIQSKLKVILQTPDKFSGMIGIIEAQSINLSSQNSNHPELVCNVFVPERGISIEQVPQSLLKPLSPAVGERVIVIDSGAGKETKWKGAIGRCIGMESGLAIVELEDEEETLYFECSQLCSLA